MTSRFAVAIFLMISTPTVAADVSPLFGSATRPPVRIAVDPASGQPAEIVGAVIVPPVASR
jgi:hypothetical protein